MPTDPILDAVLNSSYGAIANFTPGLVMWGARILTITTFLGGLLAFIYAVRQRDNWMAVESFLISLAYIGVVVYGVSHALEWGLDLLNMGKLIGSQISGISPDHTTPSGVFDLGLRTIKVLFHASTLMLLLHPLNTGGFIVITLLTLLAWGTSAVTYLFTLIQVTFTAAIGPFQLSIAALEYTSSMIYVWFEGMLSAAVKLMATLLTLGFGENLAMGWATHYEALGITINTSQTWYAVEAGIQAGVFMGLVGVLPMVAHRLVKVHLGGAMGWNDAGAWSLLNAWKKAGHTAFRTGRYMLATGVA